MAILPRVVTEASASGAQVIDSSLKFDKDKEQYLTRTPSTAGNRKTFTWSVWLKRSRLADGSSNVNHNPVFCAGNSGSASTDWRFQNTSSSNDDEFWWINWDGGTTYFSLESSPRYRDVSGFYHIVGTYDGTTAKVYINGTQVTAFNTSTQNGGTSKINSTSAHSIGCFGQGALAWFGGSMSQFYLIDGQALDATYFGYTDPLTNTWRPKKFSGSYDTSALTTNPTGIGGYPILNTNASGGAVTSGYRTDKNPSGTDVSSYLVLAIPGNGLSIADVSADVKGSGSNKTITLSGGNPVTSTTQSAFYGKSVHLDGDDDFTCGSGSDYAVGTAAFTAEGWFWFNSLSSSQCLMEWTNNASATGSPSGRSDGGQWYFSSGSKLQWYQNGTSYCDNSVSPPLQTWCHMAVVVTGGTMKMYIDGVEKSSESYSLSLGNSDGNLRIGLQGATYFNGYINDFRFYKGVAKYTAAFTPAPRGSGNNTCYLPFDGKTPIGEDQSGKGNNWTPVNFGGSTVITKATGAFPILNTMSGGKLAVPGVRGQAGVAVTVYNSGSGNKYYLDGLEAGTVNFVPGQTVTFDTSNSTVSGHPFRLSPKSGGSHGTTDYSVDFDGTGDYLSIGSHADTTLGGVDFTMECWVYFTGSGTDVFFENDTGTGGCSIQINGSNLFSVQIGATNITGAAALATSTWHHLCVQRDHSASRTNIYVNGMIVNTTTTDSGSSTSAVTIGGRSGGSFLTTGKIADVRLVKGSLAYDFGGFTPPSSPLTNVTNTKLLCCQSSAVTTSVVSSGGAITANGDPTVSTDTPYDTYPFGTVTGASEGSAGAATTITIPNNAPSNLYYYCTNHSGMGGSIDIGGIDSSVADPYAWKNVLAIPVSGTVGTVDVSSQVNPAGSSKKAVSIIGATEKGFPTNFYGRTLYFDGSGDYLQLSTSTDFGLIEQDWTVEVWYYSTGITGGYGRLWYLEGSSSSNIDGVYHSASNMSMGTTGVWSVGDGTGGDFAANTWNHIAVVHDSTNMRMYINGVQTLTTTNNFSNYSTKKLNIMTTDNNSFAGQSVGYLNDFRIYNGLAKYKSNFTPASSRPNIVEDSPSGVVYSGELKKPTSGSVVFDGSSDYLLIEDVTDLVLGTDDFTIEFWVYMSTYQYTIFFDMRPNNAATGGKYPTIYLDSGTALKYYTDGNDRITGSNIQSLRWYHVAVSRSGTSTKLFIDGVQQGSTYSDSNNYLCGDVTIGCRADASTGDLNGFMSNVRVVKGTAVYTSNFTPSVTPLTNISNTKLLCCQGGNAVNYAVSSGSITANGSAAAVSFNPFDTSDYYSLGKPTGYCTWSPLWKNSTQSNSGLLPTLRDGNLTADYDDSGSQTEFKTVCGTIPLDSTKGGKWYFETTSPGGGYYQVGMCREEHLWQIGKSGWGISGSSRGLCYQSDGSFGINRGSLTTSKKTASTYGQLISFLVDFDKETFNTWVDGVDVGYTVDISSYIDKRAPFWYPMISMGNFSNALTNDDSSYSNFGQKPFNYIPPEGFKPICVANLPSPGDARPDQFYGTVIYTGNGVNNRSITGFNFQPDLVVYKERNVARDWQWYDSVRGVGPAKNLVSNTNYAQDSNDDTSYGYTSAFNEGGFTLTNGTAGSGNNDIYTNDNGQTYASWCWKAGGNSNTFNVDDVGYASAAAAGLTGGDITPTGASVGTKQGFSIIKFTGSGSGTPSIPHGLSEAPRFIIQKDTGATTSWRVFAWVGDFNWQIFNLNNDDAGTNATETAPTSSLFYANGNGNAANTQIAYLWHNVPGVQKFGTYAGSGNDNGTLVELGFRPALVWVKCHDAAGQEWVVWDDKRAPSNVISTALYSNSNLSEASVGTTRKVDFLSNGFKLRNGSSGATDYSGRNYIYCAWAESPFNNLYGGQANAR